MTDIARPVPVLSGIHHLKIPVSDLATSLGWYERVLGARRVPQFDHITGDGRLFAYILDVPGLEMAVELRDEPTYAERLRGFDPVVFAADLLADLEGWAAHLDALGVENSGVLRGLLGWLVIFRDPDGLSIRIYSRETHELDIENSDIASPWVAYD